MFPGDYKQFIAEFKEWWSANEYRTVKTSYRFCSRKNLLASDILCIFAIPGRHAVELSLANLGGNFIGITYGSSAGTDTDVAHSWDELTEILFG